MQLRQLRGAQQGSTWHPQHTQPQHIPSSSWLQIKQGQHPDCLLQQIRPNTCFSLSGVKQKQSKAVQLIAAEKFLWQVAIVNYHHGKHVT